MPDSLQHALLFYSSELLRALLLPIENLGSPDNRIFWLFLVSSALLTVWWLYSQRLLNRQMLSNTFLNRHYWLHPSSLQDIGWLCLNNIIRIFLVIPIVGSHLAATIMVAAFLQTQVSDSPDIAWPPWLIMTLFTISFFVLEDFSRFYLHRLMHKIPLLWKLHRIHHSAKVLTPFTLYRLHPLEMCLYQLRKILVFGLVSGVFVWLFQSRVDGWAILGVDAVGFMFNAIGANLRHSHIPLTFGAGEKLFISPAQHQIHHSNQPQHYDKNFGTCLAIWDKMFHSWLPGNRAQKIRFGL